MHLSPPKMSRFASIVCAALLIGACAAAPKAPPATRPAPPPAVTPAGAPVPAAPSAPALRDVEIEDLRKIPQNLSAILAAGQQSPSIGESCRNELLHDFRRRFFRPWTSRTSQFDNTETVDFMKQEARGTWYGVNNRRVPHRTLQEILRNCDLHKFPSRNDRAIAVAPGHLRGLPTPLPLYEPNDGPPFDMLSYPQMKLNEPLRVLHVSRDGAWYFVETGYTNGWIEKRDVALVDDLFVEYWMQAPQVVVTRDFTPVADGKEVATFPVKLGTILPLIGSGKGGWEVSVASAGEGGEAEIGATTISLETASPFPLTFDNENIAQIGNQLLGQPYGWGEQYDLRDCSALLRDFFMPFGIWLPRTSADQIASAPGGLSLVRIGKPEKAELIRKRGRPFLSLLYKPGHIMLYAGEDADGRPLVFHDAWSVLLKNGTKGRKLIVGGAAVTSLEPGKELGLLPGASLLEKATELATITNRCRNEKPQPTEGRKQSNK